MEKTLTEHTYSQKSKDKKKQILISLYTCPPGFVPIPKLIGTYKLLGSALKAYTFSNRINPFRTFFKLSKSLS